MRNIKLTIEYDGTNYQGWQIQRTKRRDAPTIQFALEQAIPRVVQHPVQVTGSGRTDSGVHAAGQAANFFTESAIPAENLIPAINSYLPRDIAVVQAGDVPLDFHARYSAKSKTYRYTVLNREARCPLLRDRVWHLRGRLEIDRMIAAARCLIGEHDFHAFQSKAAESDDGSSVRTVSQLDIAARDCLIEFSVSANGFLYNMVRAIVGTLVQVGYGRLQPDDVKRILDSRDRSQAGPTAPAKGLCLVAVYYEEDRSEK